MKKRTGAGMVMTIALSAILTWVLIVGLVIRPGPIGGAFLSLAGGCAIGLIIVYLMRRWWFRRPLADRMADVLKDEKNNGS